MLRGPVREDSFAASLALAAMAMGIRIGAAQRERGRTLGPRVQALFRETDAVGPGDAWVGERLLPGQDEGGGSGGASGSG